MAAINKHIAKYLIPENLVNGLIDGLGSETIEEVKVPTHKYTVTVVEEKNGNTEIDLLYDDRYLDYFPNDWGQYKVDPVNEVHHKFLNI
ncbi:hypothetical protein [Flavicella sediminum]|uniref:hypothetical protein n=1 Tax=Flavicella sediminum TaxID=2585141 RepID=UPI00111DDF53|nr:hypothetical protein [Flavicella sediminum]